MTYRRAARALACLASVILVTGVIRVTPATAGVWTPPEIAEESLFQAIHLIDLGQTLDIHRHDNLEEMGFEQGGCAWAIGHYPSESRIYAYMGAEAAAHFVVTDLLVHFGRPWMVHTFEAATISVNALVINDNARLGLTVKF